MLDENGQYYDGRIHNGGGYRGGGRKRTAADGELRKMRSLRASDDEWEQIKKFAAELKKNWAQYGRNIKLP